MHAVRLSNAAGRRVKCFGFPSLKTVKTEQFLAKLAKFP
jgi:hypothetical protein